MPATYPSDRARGGAGTYPERREPGDLALTTLSTTGGTSRDTNTILSGSGWHMSGERIQVTATSQATARDGHREGACLLLDMPSGWRNDGSQGVAFVLDDWLWPASAGSLMWFGACMVDPGASQADQVGGGACAHDNAGPTVRLPLVNPANQATSTSLGAALRRQEIYIEPLYSGGVLTFGMVSSVGYHSTPAVPDSVLSVMRTDAVGSAPKLAICAGFTGTAVGTNPTMGARVRVGLYDFLPRSAVFS